MTHLEQLLLLGLDQAPSPASEDTLGLSAPNAPWSLWLRVGAEATEQLAGKVSAPVEGAPQAPVDPRPVIPGSLADVIPLAIQRKLPWLLSELAEALGKRGARVSAGSLPTLLNASEALREGVRPLLGPVGEWLAAQNPRWGWAVGAADDGWVRELEEESGAARAQALERGRRLDRELATEMLLQTLAKESAAERERLVRACAGSLSSLDTGWLEELASTDRSKKVRAQCRSMLVLLPQSPTAQGYRELAETCLSLEKQERSLGARLMRRTEALRLSAEVPPEQEGLEPEKHWGLGPQQGRLAALLAMVNPRIWPELWGVEPGRLVLAVDPSDDIAVLIGWTEAAIRFGASEWAGPLHRLWSERPSRLGQALQARLPAVMSAEDLESRCLELLQSHGRRDPGDLDALLRPLPTPWSPRLGAAWLARVRPLHSIHQLPQLLHPTLELAARGIPAAQLPAQPLLPGTSAAVVLRMATLMEARRRIHAFSLG
ncbi:MAG: DUF5691 domain-containing protein [Myxococcota bacterium]|nr:DUF5691 domain-containing protein [Myxococcota bacterium]